jgi:hypothetical protein
MGSRLSRQLASCILSLAARALLAGVLVAGSAWAQGIGETGTMQVTLRIPPAGYLDLAGAGAGAELQASAQPGSISVLRVHVRRGAGSRVIVPLLVRSNAPYELHARLAWPLTLPGQAVTVAPIAIAANAGGGRVMAQASNVSAAAATLTATQEEALLLEGPRVSRGGNNSTPDNALLVQFEVVLPESLPEADLLFQMKLK